MKIRPALGVLASAALVAGFIVTAAIGHVDDPKARDLLPPVYGPIYHEGQGSTAEVFPFSGINLKSWIPLNNFTGSPTSGNDCWGYVSPSGKEYAIMGLSNGTAFVDITNPSAATTVGHIAGPTSLWRCVKVYGAYCYAGTEAGGGMQVIDMTNIDGTNPSAPRVVLSSTVTTGGNSLNTHTLTIDTASGYLYRAGGGSNGIRVYDVKTNPANPTFVGQWNNVYVHECQVVTYTSGAYAGKQIAFCCGGSNGGQTNTGLYIVDVTNKAAMTQLSYTTYPGAKFCHQSWLSNDQRRVYINDELDEGSTVSVSTTIVINVSSLTAPVVEPTFTNGNPAIGHNLYIGQGNKLFEANYKSGLRVFDLNASYSNPPEIAYFDTWPADDGAQFNGLWNVWPYFPSGTVIGSDINRGLFVWRLGGPAAYFTYPNGLPTLVAPSGGSVTIQVAPPAGTTLPANSVKMVVTVAGVATTVTMEPLGSNLYRGAFPTIPCTSSFTYEFRVDSVDGPYPDPAGLRTAVAAVSLATPVDDTCEAQGSWALSATGDNATSGLWINADPVATAAQSEDDHTAAGTRCFVTGNGAVGGVIGEADVDGGTTTLTSPVFDGTGDQTFVSYWRWYSNDQGSNPNEDSMPISISNDGGVTWTQLELVSTNSNAWVQRSFRISDFVVPTTIMKVRFVARDIGVGGSIVEAAIDDFQVIRYSCNANPADLNGDRVVNGADLGHLLAGWGQPGRTDLNGSGTTDGADLGMMLSAWGG
jgi:choice-of-anchor B domain-containing protein